ncbi:MAG: hypothetical protein H6728_01090 [Myxococcales bacterium]|nr:hypothetical protein [Myxococcales bacterium]
MKRYAQDSKSMRRLLHTGSGAWHMYLEANYNFPFEVGARLAIQMPGGIRLAASYGMMQQAILQEANKALLGADTYGAHVGRVIDKFLQTSSVWRAHLEWRPFERHGFYMGLSYVQMSFRGQVNAADLADISLGFQGARDILQATSYQVETKLSLAVAELGWEWTILYIFNLRLGLGVAKLIGHEVNISAQFDKAVSNEYKQQILEKAGRGAEIINLTLQQYNIYPSLSVGLGVRFF